MIIRTRRRNETIRTRIARALSKSALGGQLQIMPQEAFEKEIARETDRSNRRRDQREFALISIDFSDRDTPDTVLAKMTQDFVSRLRISDSLGWFDLRLAVLLPETGKEGAAMVANDLLGIAKHYNVAIDTRISIFPWDDTITSIASELHSTQSTDRNATGGPDSGSGGLSDDGNAQSYDSANHQFFQTIQRFDTLHTNKFGSSTGPHFTSDEDSYRARQGAEPSVSVCEPPAEIQNDLPASASFASNSRPEPLKESKGTGIEVLFRSDRTPWWKRTIDITFAGTGLLVLSPVFLVAAAAVKLSSPGPVFFKQMREGKEGKPFGILKFRTMIADAEAAQAALRDQSEQDGPAFKLKNDPRITRVGRYLRKSCIDELPQLLNVVRGEMSLVGPRPLPVGESHQCSAWQRQRLSVLPGLTCIWQAHGGRNIAFSEWMRMDMEYIRRRSMMYDLRLIVETAFIALLQRGSV